MALVVSAVLGTLPKDLTLTVAGTKYYLNAENKFIVPFGAVKSNSSVDLKFESVTLQSSQTPITINVELWVSLTSDQQNVLNGTKVFEKNVDITIKSNPSITIESFDNRIIYRPQLLNALELTYQALNIDGCTITIEAQKKTGGSYQTASNIINYVDNSNVNSGGVYDISNQIDGVLEIKLSSSLASGTYRFVIKVASSKGEDLKVIYNFVVLD